MLTCPYTKMSRAEMLCVLNTAVFGSLNVAENGQPYAIPAHYKVKCSNQSIKLTVLSPQWGMKMRCIENNDKVCMLITEDSPELFKSVVIFGCAEIIPDPAGGQESIIQITVKNMTGRAYAKAMPIPRK